MAARSLRCSHRPQDIPGDEQAIRVLKDTFARALLSGDASLRASIWTENGTVVPPQGGLFRGRAEMAKHFQTEAQSLTRDSKATFSNYRFRFINRDVAFVDADLTLNNVHGPEGKVAPVVPISVTFTAVRKDGAWLIQDERAHFNWPQLM